MFYYFDYDEPLYRPPSEARSLIFQITLGCSQNSCTFCGMYKTKRFRLRSFEEIAAEIAAVPEHHRQHVQRVFLADGDALIYPQQGLLEILAALQQAFPRLTRVGIYASPNSLQHKSVEQLRELRAQKLRILYFGLESGDDLTLATVGKGFTSAQMLEGCQRAREAGLKISVTAILGLAGRERSLEHARATAAWVTSLSPEYFSLLTLFYRHNDDFFRSLSPLTREGILLEALEMLTHLNPQRTILRSNHISNFLNLAGSYPKDRERLIAQVKQTLLVAGQRPAWLREVPDYREERF
ncbi:MAG: radical SAM protein [Desulfuromonas sp.]|nr:MAG: radical SAM protein [Desulfuromonas sp.]